MPVTKMNVKEHVFQKMKEELEQKTQAEVDAILAEVEEVEQRTMASIQEEVKRDADLKLKQELEEMQTVASGEMAEDRILMRKKLLAKRDEYVKAIFDEARAQLIDFTSSPDYQHYLISHLEKASAYGFASPVIEIKAEDLKYSDDIKKVFGPSVIIKINEMITIGGFILKDQETAIELNETLDFALENQDEWFKSHSGLVINKEGI
ncbi:MAG: hypothetical protein J6P61_10015 [Erysipelotrichaceae bacterium]|nr:hypothetical protein [Erysipelotrichaceae bacterium]